MEDGGMETLMFLSLSRLTELFSICAVVMIVT